MSFFKKLKDKLTRSSSKIDEGLEAIVSEGTAEPEVIDAPAQIEVEEPVVVDVIPMP